MSKAIFVRIGAVAALFTLFSKLESRASSPFDQLPFVPLSISEVANYKGLGQSADYAAKVVVSQSGRIYVMGHTIDVGVQDYILIYCYKPDGTLIWKDTRPINGFIAHDLVVDENDNAFAIGMVFNDGGFPSSQDVGIMKYNAEGFSARDDVYELDFIEPLINPFFSENRPTAVALGPNGKLYISGYVSDDPFAEPRIISHPVLFAVDTAGRMSLDWESTIHAAAANSLFVQEIPVSIAVTSAGDVYELSNYGPQENGITLRRVSASGSHVWSDSATIAEFGTRGHSAVNVGVDANGVPYVTGTVETDSGSDIFVAKFNPATGAATWVETLPFGENSRVEAARVLPDGSVIGAGSVDFGGSWTIFRVNSDGAVQWEQRYAADTAQNLTIDRAGNIYVVGIVPFEQNIGVAKFSSSGQFVWGGTLPDAYALPGAEKRPPTIAVDSSGAAYVTAHRDLKTSEPVNGGTYPIFDAVLFKVQTTGIEPPVVRFITPTEGQIIAPGSSFPKISLEASSPVGIQKIALYAQGYNLLTVLTNPPYEVTLSGAANLSQIPLYAVAFDNLGYASYTKVAPTIDLPSYTIEFAQPAFRVSETESEVSVRARRTRTIGQALVKVTMTPGTASTADYNNAGNHEPFSLYFADGDETAQAYITIEKDTTAESEETFTLTLSEPTAGALGALTTANVTIVDNDSGGVNPYGTIEFSSFNYNVTEAEGAVDVTIVRSVVTESGAISYYTQPDKASEGLDYLGTLGTIYFAPGEQSKTLRMYTLKDSIAEAVEPFYITLHHPENGAALGGKWYTLVHIQDENGSTSPATISFDSSAISVREGVLSAIVAVRRQGSSAGTASVSYKTVNGTANGGADYTSVAGVLTFNSGETIKTVQVPIVADGIAEEIETLSIELSGIAGATFGAHSRVIISITEETSQEPSGETLAGWITSSFTAEERVNSQISGEFADPDNDGYPNVVEYALGLNPKTPNAENLIEPEVAIVNGQPALQVTFTRPIGRTDLDYIFEALDKFGSTPCDLCAEVVATDNGNGTETVRVRVAGSLTAARSAFLIFKVGKK